MTKRSNVTGSDLLQKLEADPQWVAAKDARDRDAKRRAKSMRQELEPLTRDLASIGLSLNEPSEIHRYRSHPIYQRALPVLLDHLSRDYDDAARERIARTFECKEARLVAWDPLLTVLKSRAMPRFVTQAIVASISAMARPGDLPTLIALINERAIGESRAMLVGNLARSKKTDARVALHDLRDDPDLQKEIGHRLKRSSHG